MNVATAHVCRFYSNECRNSSLLFWNLLYQVIFVNTITRYIDIKRRHRFSPPGLLLVSQEVVNWLNDEGDKFQARPVNACRSEAITVSLFFRTSNPPRHPPPWWIVIRCARNINKDGARFGVRVRSWQSYGKIEDCKQSIVTSCYRNRSLAPAWWATWLVCRLYL